MSKLAPLVLFAGVAAVRAALGPVASAAPVPKHLAKDAETDKAKLQGKWRMQSMQMGGKDVGGGALPGGIEMIFEFKGDNLLATMNGMGEGATVTAVVKHDTTPGAKRFTATETRIVEGNNGMVRNEKDEAFSYAFDGDKLLLAAPNGGNKGAPVDPLKPGPNDMVIVFVKVK